MRDIAATRAFFWRWGVLAALGLVLFSTGLQALGSTLRGRSVITGDSLVDLAFTALVSAGAVAWVVVLLALSARHAEPARTRLLRRWGAAVVVAIFAYLALLTYLASAARNGLDPSARTTVLLDLPGAAPVLPVLLGLLLLALAAAAGLRLRRRNAVRVA